MRLCGWYKSMHRPRGDSEHKNVSIAVFHGPISKLGRCDGGHFAHALCIPFTGFCPGAIGVEDAMVDDDDSELETETERMKNTLARNKTEKFPFTTAILYVWVLFRG